MKKILSFIFVILLLISCGGKTKFENLSIEKKSEIISTIQKELLPEMMKKIMPLAFSDLSEEEIDKKTKDIFSKLLDEKIISKYHNIDFSDLKKTGLKKDNSKSEDKKENVEKKYTKIKLGEFTEMIGANKI